MWGAVEGFRNTNGWNGCVSLPRQLEISDDGHLIQCPVEELKMLRKEKEVFSGTLEPGINRELFRLESGTAEVILHIKQDGIIKILLPCNEKIEIVIAKDSICAGDKSAVLEKKEKRVLNIYLDKTVIEIFLPDGTCLTSVLSEPLTGGKVEIIAEQGKSYIEAEAYNLNCTDLFSKELFC